MYFYHVCLSLHDIHIHTCKDAIQCRPWVDGWPDIIICPKNSKKVKIFEIWTLEVYDTGGGGAQGLDCVITHVLLSLKVQVILKKFLTSISKTAKAQFNFHTAGDMKTIPSVYTLLGNTIYPSHSTKVAVGTVFRKHTRIVYISFSNER